jgi:hypothetical protein
MTCSLEDRVRVRPGVLFRELDGEGVLLEMDSGRYFGLDDVATRIWALLGEHARLSTVHERLLAEYEVAEEQLRSDLLSFVQALLDHNLLERESG